MDKKTGIIIGIIIVAFAGLIGATIIQGRSATEISSSTGDVDFDLFERSKISSMAEQINLDNIDPHTVLKGSDESGNLPDNVKGDPDKAELVIFEYADYQCAHCAEWNPTINALVSEYDGKLAVVFRNYVLSYSTNGVMVGAAVEAAAIQGYWADYKDYVFANQDDWYYSKQSKLQTQLEDYFSLITKGQGDIEKFRADMQSESVAKKLALDMALAEKVDLQGTPAIYIDGQFVKLTDVQDTVAKRLKS